MKPVSKPFTKDSVAEQLCMSAREIYERINESCNNFLKTQRGIQYLIMKYPQLTIEQAILEYYCDSMIAENYDPTCQSEW